MGTSLKVLVLGVSGMLGSAVFRYLSTDLSLQVYGTARSSSILNFLTEEQLQNVIFRLDVEHPDELENLFLRLRPDVVINCIGVIKQLDYSDDPLVVIPINSLLPHRLNKLCARIKSRLIHISTDCVFSGRSGRYMETDYCDADDLYGRSKFLGELNTPNSITLRTSIIGHEIGSEFALINWFLSQKQQVLGYRKAVFSGLPTVEVARVIREYVIPNSKLTGLYHLAADPINKCELLKLVALTYEKNIEIVPDDSLCIDRSLNATKFFNATGYSPPSWSELIKRMYEFR